MSDSHFSQSGSDEPWPDMSHIPAETQAEITKQIDAARERMPPEHLAQLLREHHEVLSRLATSEETSISFLHYVTIYGPIFLEYCSHLPQYQQIPGAPWLQYHVQTAFVKEPGHEKWKILTSKAFPNIEEARAEATKLRNRHAAGDRPRVSHQWIEVSIKLRPIVVEWPLEPAD